MDLETIKLLGSASAQLLLAAGYAPMFWLIIRLWKDRADLQKMLFELVPQTINATNLMTRALDLLTAKLGVR